MFSFIGYDLALPYRGHGPRLMSHVERGLDTPLLYGHQPIAFLMITAQFCRNFEQLNRHCEIDKSLLWCMHVIRLEGMIKIYIYIIRFISIYIVHILNEFIFSIYTHQFTWYGPNCFRYLYLILQQTSYKQLEKANKIPKNQTGSHQSNRDI